MYTAGMDRLERLKGIPLKLMAIEQFISQNPYWLGKVVFLMVGVSAGERGADYKVTQSEVLARVKILNAKYSHNSNSDPNDVLVHFEECSEKDFRLARRLPFFAAADVYMNTATR